MKKIIKALLLISVLVINPIAMKADISWQEFSKYLKNIETVSNFDGLKLARNDSGYLDLKINKKSIDLKEKDTIPKVVYNEFIKTYIGRPRPFTFFNTCGAYSYTELSNVGYSLFCDYCHLCQDQIFPILKKTDTEKDNLEFVLFILGQTDIQCTMFYYSIEEDKIKSYVVLHSGETSGCHLKNIEIYPSPIIQTTEIKNGLITQLVNDGLNALWKQKIYLNKEAGGYLKLWDEQPYLDENIEIYVYKVIIQDQDGYTNVRKKPDVSSDILYRINKDEVFVVDQYDCNGWYHVLSYKDKYDGWIHKSRVKILSKETEF